MANWPELWLRKQGGVLPSRYVAIDLETSGFSLDDYVVNIAHIQVNDGKIEHMMSVFIDWRQVPGANLNRLRTGLERVRRDLSGYDITWEKLCEVGMPAQKVFQAYHDIFTSLMKRGYYIAGHNSYRFDEPRLAKAMAHLQIAPNFSFTDKLIDSQALEIASRESNESAVQFLPSDTMRTWCTRLVNHGNKFKAHKLMEHLVPKYDLVINEDKAHEADVGARAVHLLMEHFRAVCNNRANPLHASQWRTDVAASMQGNPVPPPGIPIKPISKGVVLQQPLRRMRGQRSN